MFILICLSMTGYGAFAASRVTVSLTAIGLQAPTFVVGLLLSLYAMLPMLLSVSMGRWVDRVGSRRPMLLGMAGLATACAIPASFTTLPALFVNSVFAGTGFILFHICIQKLTGEVGTSADRVRNFGMLSVGYSASGFLGPICAGWLIDHVGSTPGYWASFAMSVGLASLTFALMQWVWRIDVRGSTEPVSGQSKGRVLDLLKTPQLRSLYVAVVMPASAWRLQMFLVPVQGSQVGLSASQIGLVLGAFSAATFVVRLAMPIFARRFSEWQMIGGAQAAAGLVYLAFPLVTSHYGMIALAFLLGLGLGTGHPSVMALLHRVTPPNRLGEAVGLRMAMVNATQTTMPTAFGALGSALSVVLTGSLVFAPMFWGVAVMLGFGSHSALRRRHE